MPARRTPDRPPLRGIFEILQDHYAAELLLQLARSGALERMTQPRTAAAIARMALLPVDHTAAILRFLAATTDVIEAHGARSFRLGGYSPRGLAFQLEKFAGAYGECVRKAGGGRVDAKALAAAFTAAPDGVPPAFDSIRRSGVHSLLDLGCGTGSLLVLLGAADPSFRGIGIDSNPHMCAAARRAIRQARLSSRITIRRAEAVGAIIPSGVAIEAVHGASFLNALFGSGSSGVVSALKRLRALLPGRKAFFVDYYGELTGNRSARPAAMLQDVAQLLSGQGIPPPDARAWRQIYSRAGCRVIRMTDHDTPLIRWFIHEIQL